MTYISSFSCYNVDMKQQKQDNFVISAVLIISKIKTKLLSVRIAIKYILIKQEQFLKTQKYQ